MDGNSNESHEDRSSACMGHKTVKKGIRLAIDGKPGHECLPVTPSIPDIIHSLPISP